MSDNAKPRVREHTWALKIDKTTEPPTILEEVEILDGELVGVRAINRPMTAQEQADYEREGGGIEV